MTHRYAEETIEQYILGTLPESEKRAFETELQKNKAFKQHVREQTVVIKAISDFDQDTKVSKAIKAASANYFDSLDSASNAKVKKIGWTKWAIAAAAGLAILITATFLLRMQSFDAEKAFAEYFEPGTMLEIDRSTDSLKSTDLTIGYQAYQQGDYETALEQFSIYFAKNPATAKDLNYAGMAALALPEPDIDRAAEYFLKIIEDGDSKFKNSANWHLALISLKKKDEEGAIRYLENLDQGAAHKYTDRSRELLKKLR